MGKAADYVAKEPVAEETVQVVVFPMYRIFVGIDLISNFHCKIAGKHADDSDEVSVVQVVAAVIVVY